MRQHDYVRHVLPTLPENLSPRFKVRLNPVMLTLEYSTAHFKVQDAVFAELRDSIFDENHTSNHLRCEVSFEHECFGKEFNHHDGLRITLRAYLKRPAVRARKRQMHVKIHALNGMANGPSRLRNEVRMDEAECGYGLRRSDSDEW